MHDCTICLLGFLFCSDCSIRVSRFFMQNVISCSCPTFNKANLFMLENDFQSTDYDDDDWYKWVLIIVYYPTDWYQNVYNIGFNLMEY